MTSVRLVLLAAIPLIVSPLLARPVSACGNEVYRRTDPRTIYLVRADKALQRGHLRSSARLVRRAFAGIRRVEALKPRASGLLQRALRTAAIVTVRSDGRITLGPLWPGKTAKQQASNLRWAANALRQLDKRRPGSPALQTALGEALSKLPENQPEALTILRKLAQRDVVTSAHGYAALARLHAAAGNRAERDKAVRRCESMRRRGDHVVCAIKSVHVAARL